MVAALLRLTAQTGMQPHFKADTASFKLKFHNLVGDPSCRKVPLFQPQAGSNVRSRASLDALYSRWMLM
jgi:hypothetical protein